jgi:HEAT repeat protein
MNAEAAPDGLPAGKPGKNLRGAILWSAAILAALGLAWGIAAFFATMRQTSKILTRYAWHGAGGGPEGGGVETLSPEEAVRALGGPRLAALKLRLYIGLPRRMMRREDPRFAVGLLGHCGRPAVPYLLARLRQADDRILDTVIIALGNAGPDAAPAVPELLRFLSAEESLRRGYVVWALGRIGSPAAPAVPELVRLLTDQNQGWLFRRDVAKALGGIGPDARDAVPALESALKDEDAGVRAAAAEALKRIRGGAPKK